MPHFRPVRLLVRLWSKVTNTKHILFFKFCWSSSEQFKAGAIQGITVSDYHYFSPLGMDLASLWFSIVCLGWHIDSLCFGNYMEMVDSTLLSF